MHRLYSRSPSTCRQRKLRKAQHATPQAVKAMPHRPICGGQLLNLQVNGDLNESVVAFGIKPCPRGWGRTHLHGTCAFVRASLGSSLEAISHSPAGRPVPGRQMLHEFLQADHAVVPPERLQPEVLRVRDVQLWGNRAPEPGGPSPGARSSSPESSQPCPPRPRSLPAPAGGSRWCRAGGGAGTRSRAARPGSG